MMGSNFDGGDLVVKQLILEDGRDAKVLQPGTRLLREMIGHLEVDVVGWGHLVARPAFIDNLGKFVGDIQAPALVPALVKPALQFLARITVQHINVEFALVLESCQREVAAAKIANDGGNAAFLVEQVELGMQLVAQKEFDNDALCFELRAEPAQPFLILIRRCAHH